MSNCLIKRILRLNEAMLSQPLLVFDQNKTDITNSCKYSWSVDGVCWTSWASYNDYLNITKNLDNDFYLRILLFGDFDKLIINGCISNDYHISLDNTNIFLKDFCGNENLFQPYDGLDCALLLQQQLADSVICMLGIPIYYIKVSPNIDSADYTFKEYSLHGVESIKQMKLMIPDGTMPSSNPKLTEFDFDWEIDWETELSKTQFAKAFGDEAIPKQRDLIYIPMMKRMWEVNSAYDERNEMLLWRSTTWKLALVKYNEKTNVDHGIFSEIIDGWIEKTYEDTFGEIERIEQERETGAAPLSSPKFAATNLFDIFMEDNVRKQYTKNDITILDKIYCHRSNVVARNIYKFKNDNGCITYQKPICGESGTLSFILETPGTLNGKVSKDILNFGNVDANVTYDKGEFGFEFNGLKCKLEAFNTYMVIMRWNRDNYTSELNVYKLSHPSNIPVYRLKPEMYYFDIENPICELMGEYNNDYIHNEPMLCQIHPHPVLMSNIKFYNTYLNLEEILKECIKYTTSHQNCVINDLARPINSGQGYSIK